MTDHSILRQRIADEVDKKLTDLELPTLLDRFRNDEIRESTGTELAPLILANLHHDLSEIDRKNDPTNDAFRSPYLYGFVNGIRAAQAEIRKILDTYDDPDFIRDFLEEDQ